VRTKDHEFRNTESPVFTLAFDSVRNRSFPDVDAMHRAGCRARITLDRGFGERLSREPGARGWGTERGR